MYAILMLIAGMSQAAMASFNGVLSDTIGIFGVSLATHISGGLLLLLYILLFVRKKIVLHGMPWYLYSAGILGIILVSMTSFCIQRLGASVTTCMSVFGQLLLSTIIDHYGLFHMPKVPFHVKRLPAFIMVLAGIILLNLPS